MLAGDSLVNVSWIPAEDQSTLLNGIHACGSCVQFFLLAGYVDVLENPLVGLLMILNVYKFPFVLSFSSPLLPKPASLSLWVFLLSFQSTDNYVRNENNILEPR